MVYYNEKQKEQKLFKIRKERSLSLLHIKPFNYKVLKLLASV